MIVWLIRCGASASRPSGPTTCTRCHDGSHGRSFDYEPALARIAHPARPPADDAGGKPEGPSGQQGEEKPRPQVKPNLDEPAGDQP